MKNIKSIQEYSGNNSGYNEIQESSLFNMDFSEPQTDTAWSDVCNKWSEYSALLATMDGFGNSKYKSTVSAATEFLKKNSTIKFKDNGKDRILKNSEVIYYAFYWGKTYFKNDKRFPMSAAMYDLIKPT